MLKSLLEKEFKQLVRNPFLPRLILIMPLMMLLVMPWAANRDIKNINLSIIDNDHSTFSTRLVQKMSASGYFILESLPATTNQGMQSIESGQADVLLEIQPDFEKSLITTNHANVMIGVNAVNGSKAGISMGYVQSIIGDFATELSQEMGLTDRNTKPIIDVKPYNRFNIYLEYKVFMVPALVVMLLTLLTGFLPALNIVSEKEAGTIEQMNVTPVSRITFILGKLIPYWVVGFIVLTICFVLAYIAYDLIPVGHFMTIYLYASIYALVVSGLGLVISNYSDTMQQAMFVMFFFMLILILLSGLFTPISSMPDWAQYIAKVNPLSYFIKVMRSVYLKGSGISDLTTELYVLSGFAVLFNVAAMWSYKKSQ